MLSAMIVTPDHFFSTGTSGPKTASPALSKIIWTKVLTSAGLSKYKHLFPGKSIRENHDKFMWSLNTGEIVDRLRQELADGEYTIQNVIDKLGSELEEIDRWNDLAQLEKLYLDELEALKLEDACTAKMRRASAPEADPSVKRIIVVAVPDPSLLAIRSLEKLSETIPLEILVYAPEEMKNTFDDWGRPIPEEWAKMNVDIPDWADNVFVESSPAMQSSRVKKLIESDSTFGPLDITIGVPDISAVSFLKNDLLSLDMPAFDPSDVAFETHTLYRLIEYFHGLLQASTYESAATLMRHPAYLRYLDEKHGIKALELLTQLDCFQNFYLPPAFERMLEPFAKNPKGAHDYHNDFTLLGRALKVMNDHVAMFGKETFEHAWRTFLKEVYETHKIDQSIVDDRDFENAAAIVEQTLRELRDAPESIMTLTNTQASTVFMRRLREQKFHRERTDETVDLQGWLELPWSDAPFLLVTGMNEDFVPGGSLSDVFLPDSLRVKLNLRHDPARFSRDIYLMRCMIESRRKNGRVCFIAGKKGMTGDPLKPSRLMFRCEDKELPQRAELFFKEMRDETSRPGTEVFFKLDPALAAKDDELPDRKKINVTSFSTYLNCPFRFYLKNILGMEELGDEKTGIDSLDFGSIVHTVLEEMGKETKLWACPNADELATSLEQLARQYTAARFGSPLPLAVQVSLESAVQRLTTFARCQIQLVREGWKVVATEQRIKDFKYHRGFLITGKIDRIDRNDRNGKIRIIDYKTSDSASDPREAHIGTRKPETPEYNCVSIAAGNRRPSIRKWTNLQLPLYHLLHTGGESLDANIELAYFNLPKAVSATGTRVWKDFNAEIMKSAVICIKGVLESVDNSIFWPPAESTKFKDEFDRIFIHEAGRNFEVKTWQKNFKGLITDKVSGKGHGI